MVLGLVLGFAAFLIGYAAVKDERPWDEVIRAFGGTPPPPAGQPVLPGGSGTTPPTKSPPGCQPPAQLVGVKSAGGELIELEPVTAGMFQRAQANAGGGIIAVSGYRTCAEQEAACERICGDPNGCPGLCAPPGVSCHQQGKAVDVSNWSFAMPYMMAQGFQHPLPGSDPGHFSNPSCVGAS